MRFLKNIFRAALAVAFAAALAACPATDLSAETAAAGADAAKLEAGFDTAKTSVRTGTYWYWITDNATRESVAADLRAMKRAGINRVFIAHVGDMGVPSGKATMFTDEWRGVLRTALKTAGELDIEVGLFNCPGWTQSGGPWVQPSQAMRFLNASETRVVGPRKFSAKLTPPSGHFQDVKVLAFPARHADSENLFLKTGANILLSENIKTAGQGERTSDRRAAVPLRELPLPLRLPNGQSHIELVLPASASARSLFIYPANTLYTRCELQVKTSGGDFRTIKNFLIRRVDGRAIVGFAPQSPAVICFPETTGSVFRIVFRGTGHGSAIAKIVLSPLPAPERYAEKSLGKLFRKMSQHEYALWGEYMWDAQSPETALCAQPEQVLDLSEKLSADGTLNWDVPAGDWVILRTGMTPTGVTNAPVSREGRGLEVDKMNRERIQEHFDAYLGKLLAEIPAEERKAWTTVVVDSYETGGQNFTDGMIEKFKQQYGYDPVPFLPVFSAYVVGSPDRSDRFLWDVRRMVADKIAHDYVGGLTAAAHKHGLKTWLENYGHWGFPGEFLSYGAEADMVGGEFWAEDDHIFEGRAAASCAHIYGKNKVSAESFTSVGKHYHYHPGMLKRVGDWGFTEGINDTVLHVYIGQARENERPGTDAWFAVEFNRNNTWFKHLDLFTDYLKRCNYLLQQGKNVADIAYFIGEDAPKLTGICEPAPPKGYDYDFINAEVLLTAQVRDGKLVLQHGASYRVLVLPPQETMRPEVLQKIEHLAAAGAVILGAPPSRSPSMKNYPAADIEIKTLATKLWGEKPVKSRAYEKGTIWVKATLQEVFASLSLPSDCYWDDTTPLRYAHRSVEGVGEVYFIANRSTKAVEVSPVFRVAGLQPELWDAVSGKRRLLPAFSQDKKTTTVPLRLEENESAFIVFAKHGKPLASDVAANFPEHKTVLEIKSPWAVRFESDAIKRGPAESVIFDKLHDWRLNSDPRIRDYSGAAVYTTSFELADVGVGKSLWLDLGKVSAMAKIKVNGHYVGGVWTPPLRLEISQFARAGKNEVEVEVVNTWTNRIVGDRKLPDSERKVVPRHGHWDANSPTQESGLLGPVRLTRPHSRPH
ncbi:MAG: hypothetical protein LBT53_07535 [Puniceicoccales bacterium]|jgi:hypothetical protein|nr:hypothetical protein [Puniceicoccales bacterium]